MRVSFIFKTIIPAVLAATAWAGQLTVQVSADGQPLKEALVMADRAGISAVTDAQGKAVLQIADGSQPLSVYASGFTTWRGTADVPGQLTVALKPDYVFAEEMVVVGSRAPNRTTLETPVPIDVLPASELVASGLTETNQILEMLVPSFNFPRPTVTDGTDHVRPATLRGLNPDQVLVLVNGKRRHSSALLNLNGSIGRGSSAVDLNAIPAAAIDRIEVLRDGASAVYGSDAIAGVINIILKAGGGGHVSANAGTTAEDDGERQHLEGAYGWDLPSGYFNVSVEADHRDPTNRSGPDPRQQYFTQGDGTPDPREASFDRINHRYGDAEVDSTTLFFNGAHLAGDGLELYAFGNVGTREGESAGFYRRALDDRTVRALYPDGYLPLISSDIEDQSLVVGARADFDRWSFDAAASYGRNSFDFTVDNSVNVSLGTASPTSFDAGGLTYDQWSVDLGFSRQFPAESLPPLIMAIGVELREETYVIDAGEPASYIDGGTPVLDGPNAGATAAGGSQVFPGFRPSDEVDASRRSFSTYLEFSQSFGEKADASVAGRFEDHSDFGSTHSFKVAARYQLRQGLNLRGAVSTGFRAPSLAQAWYSTTATVFIDGDPFEVRTFPVDDPAAIALGAEKLRAEESVNKSVGLTMKAGDSWYFTLDGYRIDINNRIVLSENMTGSAVRGVLEDQGIFGVNGGRYFTNAVDTRTEGVDLIARYGHPLAGGRLKATFGLNITNTDVQAVAANPPELDGLDLTRIGRSELGRLEEGQPDTKMHLSFDFSRGPLSTLLRFTRFGEVVSRNNSDPDRDQTFSAEVLTDLVVNYTYRKYLTFSVGGNNILDVYPDENIPANSFNGIFRYNSISPFGFNGAYYFARVTVHL